METSDLKHLNFGGNLIKVASYVITVVGPGKEATNSSRLNNPFLGAEVRPSPGPVMADPIPSSLASDTENDLALRLWPVTI